MEKSKYTTQTHTPGDIWRALERLEKSSGGLPGPVCVVLDDCAIVSGVQLTLEQYERQYGEDYPHERIEIIVKGYGVRKLYYALGRR